MRKIREYYIKIYVYQIHRRADQEVELECPPLGGLKYF
jgi:hypothetical protein